MQSKMHANNIYSHNDEHSTKRRYLNNYCR